MFKIFRFSAPYFLQMEAVWEVVQVNSYLE